MYLYTGVSNVDLTYQLTVQNNDTFIQINYNGNTYTNSKGLRIKPLKKVSTIGSNFLVLWYMYIIKIIDSTYLLPTYSTTNLQNNDTFIQINYNPLTNFKYKYIKLKMFSYTIVNKPDGQYKMQISKNTVTNILQK